MARMVKIAAVQLPAFPQGDTDFQKKEFNLCAIEEWVSRAGKMGADLAAVGEIANIHGCDYNEENFDALINGDLELYTERTGQLARKHYLYVVTPIYGIINGIKRNMALLFDRSGQLIGQYYKVHCTEGERAYGVIPGDEWPVFKLDFGSVGIMICHDNSFPESARCLTVNGAELIVWPHVMSGWGDVYMDILFRAPAIHNGIHMIPVSYGCEPEIAWQPGMMVGRSSIIGPDATIIADAGRYSGIALATIDLDQPRLAHMWTRQGEYVFRLDMLRDRRPDTYHTLSRPVPTIAPLKGADINQFIEKVDELNLFIAKQEKK